MSYTHLTPICRGRIQAMREEGKSHSEIALTLGRHRTSIGRELARNQTVQRHEPKHYDAAKAQHQYKQRRTACRQNKKLEHQPLRKYVFEKLCSGHTPEQVAGRLPLDYPDTPSMRVSHEAIYQSIYADERMHCLIKHLPQARPKRRKRGQGKSRRGPAIQGRIGIEHRPKIVASRERFGDWEGDTVAGGHQQGFLTTLVERKSLLLCARHTTTKHASEVTQAVIEALIDMPVSWVKTITFDNGTEFAKHADIAAVLPADIYFADPYSSYQRGTNENTNGLLRRYFPKGTDLRNLDPKRLQRAVDDINNRPRKKLGYRSPYEVFQKHLDSKLGALRV